MIVFINSKQNIPKIQEQGENLDISAYTLPRYLSTWLYEKDVIYSWG